MAPATTSPARKHLRAVAGAYAKHHGPDDPRTLAARRDAAVEAVAERIAELVENAPPLTDEQRARLGLLLKPRAVSA